MHVTVLLSTLLIVRIMCIDVRNAVMSVTVWAAAQDTRFGQNYLATLAVGYSLWSLGRFLIFTSTSNVRNILSKSVVNSQFRKNKKSLKH